MSGGLNLNLSRRRSSLQIGSGRKSKDASVPVAKELDSPSPNKEVVSATAGSSAPSTPVAIPSKIKRPSRSRSSLLPDTGLGSSPTSSESSSSSSLELKMKRRSSGSASRRRASETSPQINSLKPKRGSQRLSDSELRINVSLKPSVFLSLSFSSIATVVSYCRDGCSRCRMGRPFESAQR